MKKILLTCILLLHFSSQAQSNFPTSWIGSYEGELYIESATGISDTISVAFDLLPTATTNRWTYRVSYFKTKWGDMVKDYEIYWNDSLKSLNHFMLDEKDGILIDEVFINNCFYAVFEADKNVFASMLQKTETGLYMEIRCTSPEKGTTSASAPDAKGKSYELKSNDIYNVQYAHLKRKK